MKAWLGAVAIVLVLSAIGKAGAAVGQCTQPSPNQAEAGDPVLEVGNCPSSKGCRYEFKLKEHGMARCDHRVDKTFVLRGCRANGSITVAYGNKPNQDLPLGEYTASPDAIPLNKGRDDGAIVVKKVDANCGQESGGPGQPTGWVTFEFVCPR